ncbi:hypothetical protein ID858_04240 [Xenorhabdus sp. DI]|uniref:hypothetical protein n=1 Tax=Xenorhabdus doucetiae TaxID=351671 RepID=UPI0019A04CE8|nr:MULTISPECIES: hypothetical protein [unclassified Xenorhabdus]MBD2783479.1 hypothetical protein [Xenorhabdus sp. 3]MBD2787715.1 hypothetical protein [Xenorhabdus sp. DI]MBD2797563.1 hypothetical protein [Xenorhabdus sp. 18]
MKLIKLIVFASVLSFPFLALHAKTENKVNDVKNIDCKILNGKPGQNGQDGIPDSHCKNGGKGGDGQFPGQSGGNGGYGGRGADGI